MPGVVQNAGSAGGCVKWMLGALGADPAAVPEVGAGAG